MLARLAVPIHCFDLTWAFLATVAAQSGGGFSPPIDAARVNRKVLGEVFGLNYLELWNARQVGTLERGPYRCGSEFQMEGGILLLPKARGTVDQQPYLPGAY